MPPRRSVGDRLEGLDVAEVVADEHHRVGVQLALQRAYGVALVHAAARGPPRPSGRARAPGRSRAAARSSTGVSRSLRLVGVVQAAGVHGDREALALDVRVVEALAAQQLGQLGDERGQPPRRSRREHPAVAGGPPLVAVLAEHRRSPARARRSGCADLVEVAERDRLAHRPAGDHRDRRDALGERDEHLAGVGVDVRLRRVLDDRRQGPVEVQADDGPGARRRPARRTGGAPGRCGTPWAQPTRPTVAGRDARQAKSEVRITVSRSIDIGSTAGSTRSMPRSLREQLGGVLEPLGVVDRRGRDRAVPVVGADDLPAGADDAAARCSPASPVMLELL